MKKRWYGIIASVMALLVLASTAVPALAQSEEEVTVDSEPTLTAPKVLAIKAPRVAPVGKEVTMTVFQRLSQDPVEGAAIWALTRDDAEALKVEVTQMKEEGSIAAGELDYESLVSVHGFRLGFTDEDGQLKHTFDEAGWYLLVAVKKGYIPGFKPICIGEIPHVLGLRVQWVALVSEEVTMTALQRGTQELVEGAGIWALTREEAEVLREEWTAMRESGEVAPQEGDYESLVSIHGEFLGRTNGSGQLRHAFDEAGGYLLVVIKQGYRPGFNFIRVKPIPQANEAPDILEPTQ